jgi:hypothetical protein
MRKNMHELIKNNILSKNLIVRGDNILLALSGGLCCFEQRIKKLQGGWHKNIP